MLVNEKICVAAVQMKISENRNENIEQALDLVAQAAAQGAKLILLPELFESVYFPQTEREDFFDWAQEISDQHSFLPRFQKLARNLGVVIPLSLFEKANHSYYNSVVMIDSNGNSLGTYRKAHIPDGPNYEEKYYFAPGNTPPRVFETRLGRIGCGICWDQWFPELARSLALQGAEILLYPTAIGSEPPEAGSLDTRKMWRRAMVGHAVCNAMHVVAANRVGSEGQMHFYGNSFICDPTGEIVACEDSPVETILVHEIDMSVWRRFRAGMGFFRDRRPEFYGNLLSREGTVGPAWNG